MNEAAVRRLNAQPWIRGWLFGVACLVFVMVIVGGATRLTDSGLSITEWLPILGAIPPLSEAEWLAAFAKYKQIPEYKLINRGMLLADFKFIYWWEWAHRFLGRFIGIAFAIPLLFFWSTGRIARDQMPGLLGLFILGGLQGALGWYMVKSGLTERTDVSQYRLAAHLTLAAIIFAALTWTALGIGRARANWVGSGIYLIIALLLFQIAAGGLVAGLDAGMGYNTWPLMDGSIIPLGLIEIRPVWLNLFENALTVQFQHRLIAYVLILIICLFVLQNKSKPALYMLVIMIFQVGIGIWTLLASVPISLGLIHQGGALLVLAAAVYNCHVLAARSMPPGESIAKIQTTR